MGMRSKTSRTFVPSRRPDAIPPLAIGRIPSQPSNPDLPTTQASNIDTRVITHMKFVELFMSGKLQFEDSDEEYKFTGDDLIDLGEIGRGRFGVVNKMKHLSSQKIMAVKKVRITTTTFDDNDDMRLIKQLKHEVETIRDAATCEEVVSFYGVTFKEGDCYICMELMSTSLEKVYKAVWKMGEKFNEDVLGIVGVTVLNALNCLKKLKGIMHRDVKPSNILLSLKGAVKLCDFGISGYLENSIARTKDVGCRPYMAPERLTGSTDTYDIRADVWSLGITMIEVARTRFPYKDFEEQSVFAQIKQVVYGDPQILTARDGFSTRTINFVNECLTKEVADRPNFEMLMESPFYLHFQSLPNKPLIIRNYLEKLHNFDSTEFC
uniref:Protein kinase domain-containing protein n=1 Tax=Panagrolaimus sp. JU765 TaxID=591449 RepID=A0AC34Q692_9BILA